LKLHTYVKEGLCMKTWISKQKALKALEVLRLLIEIKALDNNDNEEIAKAISAINEFISSIEHDEFTSSLALEEAEKWAELMDRGEG